MLHFSTMISFEDIIYSCMIALNYLGFLLKMVAADFTKTLSNVFRFLLIMLKYMELDWKYCEFRDELYSDN